MGGDGRPSDGSRSPEDGQGRPADGGGKSPEDGDRRPEDGEGITDQFELWGKWLMLLHRSYCKKWFTAKWFAMSGNIKTYGQIYQLHNSVNNLSSNFPEFAAMMLQFKCQQNVKKTNKII